MNATVNHRFDERNNLYVNGYYSRDRFRFDQNERYSYQNANASVEWRRIFNPLLTATFTGGYDHYDYKVINKEQPEEAYKLSFDINQYFVKTDFVWSAHDKHTLDWGMNMMYYNLNPGTFTPDGEASLIVGDRLQAEKALEYAVYVGDKWDITPAFSVNAGIRYSFFTALGPREYNLYDGNYLPSLSTLRLPVASRNRVVVSKPITGRSSAYPDGMSLKMVSR